MNQSQDATPGDHNTVTQSATLSEPITLDASAIQASESRELTPPGEENPVDDPLLFGRKSDLRYLLKWSALAASGTPQTALITGDQGIGKSALLKVFRQEVSRNNPFTIFISTTLGAEIPLTPERHFQAIISALFTSFDALLESALEEINRTAAELEISFSVADLYQNLSPQALTLSQNSFSGAQNEQAEHIEFVLNALLSKRLSFWDKLNPSKKEQLRALAFQLTDPVVLFSVGLHHPTLPQFQAAIDRYRQLSQPVPPAVAEDELAHTLLQLFSLLTPVLLHENKPCIILLDHWDTIEAQSESDRNRLKRFWSIILQGLLEPAQKQAQKHPVLICFASRSGAESKTFAGPLYGMFRNRLLLGPLSGEEREALFLEGFQKQAITLDPRLVEDVLQLSEGNPYWVLKYQRFLLKWSETQRLKSLSYSDWSQFGFNKPEDLLEMSYAKLHLFFIQQEARFHQVIHALIQFDETATQPCEMPSLIIQVQRVEPALESIFIQTTLAQLVQQDFVLKTEELPARYVLNGRQVVTFLAQKIRPKQQDISDSSKIEALKKIIPITLQAAELDSPKTMEILALDHALGNHTLRTYLENCLIEATQDLKEAVRICALENLQHCLTLDSLNCLMKHLDDRSLPVKQAALNALCPLIEAGIAHSHPTPQSLIEEMIGRIQQQDHTQIGQQEFLAQLYQALALLSPLLPAINRQDLIWPLFLEACKHPDVLLRLTAFRFFLVEVQASSIGAAALNRLFSQGLSDTHPQIREVALKGLSHAPITQDTVDTVGTLLSQETDLGLQKTLLQTLMHALDQPAVWQQVADLLLSNSTAEDLRIAVAKALGNRPGIRSETLLVELLSTTSTLPKTILWASIRSLGQIGSTQNALDCLQKLQPRLNDDILSVTLSTAIQQVQIAL